MTVVRQKEERAITSDELRGHVADVLALPLSTAQTTAALLSRVNGAEPTQVLAAALAEARERLQSADLKRALAESEEEREQLSSELWELRDGLKKLLGEAS
jgi:hypothetical protein